MKYREKLMYSVIKYLIIFLFMMNLNNIQNCHITNIEIFEHEIKARNTTYFNKYDLYSNAGQDGIYIRLYFYT